MGVSNLDWELLVELCFNKLHFKRSCFDHFQASLRLYLLVQYYQYFTWQDVKNLQVYSATSRDKYTYRTRVIITRSLYVLNQLFFRVLQLIF